MGVPDAGKLGLWRPDDAMSRRVLDSICNGVTITDATLPGAPLIYVNPAFEQMTGYSAEEVIGISCNFLQGEDRDQPGVHAVRAAIREGREERVLLRNYRKDGTPFWNELYLSPMFDGAGKLAHFVGIQNDVTAKIEAESQLADERDRLHAVAESIMDSIYQCEAVRDGAGEIVDFTFTYLNANVGKMLSIPLEKVIGGSMRTLLPVIDKIGLLELYKCVVGTGEPLVREFPIEDRNVHGSWIRVQAVKLKDGIVITASDITLRKREEERTVHQAQHDPLTALPNRSVLRDRIDQGLRRAKLQGGMLAVFLIDLDGFKAINDTLGHAAGDETLITIAGRLSSCMREVDTVIRIGGDEFIVVMPKLNRRIDAHRLAARILETVRQPMRIAGEEVALTCSIGIAIYPDSATSIEELLMRSDAAMYSAKRKGKSLYEVCLPGSGFSIPQGALAPDSAGSLRSL